jgi:hypothetical protein
MTRSHWGFRMSKKGAFVGVADHHAGADLVTVIANGQVVDRRRIELIDPGLPMFPHHHEAQGLPPAEGVRLVEKVAASAARNAHDVLATLAKSLDVPVDGLVLRAIPPLPATIAERIADYRAQNVADPVMYRMALAEAARARKWAVLWYEKKDVFREAADALGLDDIEPHLTAIGKALGAPWRASHKMATAAAISAGARRSRG